MQLYLIRHAESTNNARPEHLREEDPPITELGRRQAEHLAGWVQSLAIDTLITSPFLRTVQTTSAILREVPSEVQVWHDVFELGGCYRGHSGSQIEGAPGMSRSAIDDHLRAAGGSPVLDESISEAGWWDAQARETWDAAQDRAVRIVQRLVNTFGASGETVVAVIHADIKRLVLAECLAPVVDATQLGPLRNTGISKLDYNGSRWTLDWFNSVSHLPSDAIGWGEGSTTPS